MIVDFIDKIGTANFTETNADKPICDEDVTLFITLDPPYVAAILSVKCHTCFFIYILQTPLISAIYKNYDVDRDATLFPIIAIYICAQCRIFKSSATHLKLQ